MYVTMTPNVRKYITVPSGIVMVMLPSELRSYGSIMLAHIYTFWPKLLVLARAGPVTPKPRLPAIAATTPKRPIHDISVPPLVRLSNGSSVAVQAIH
jgi:hypothetical protein